MKLLNLGCGSQREGEPWINLDCLRETLAIGTPERMNLDAEPNYVEHRLGSGPLPFEENAFDGILCSHVIEHFDCQEAAQILRECRRVLRSRGVIIVSVPDASIFRARSDEDTVENAVRIFGEPIHEADGETTFMEYALFNRFHKQVLTEDALWCHLARAGFVGIQMVYSTNESPDNHGAYSTMVRQLNRLQFSLIMEARKP